MSIRRVLLAAFLVLGAAALVWFGILSIQLGGACDPDGSSIQLVGDWSITNCHSMIGFSIAIVAVGAFLALLAGVLLVRARRSR